MHSPEPKGALILGRSILRIKIETALYNLKAPIERVPPSLFSRILFEAIGTKTAVVQTAAGVLLVITSYTLARPSYAHDAKYKLTPGTQVWGQMEKGKHLNLI